MQSITIKTQIQGEKLARSQEIWYILGCSESAKQLGKSKYGNFDNMKI